MYHLPQSAQVFMLNNQARLVVVKEKDARHKENLKEPVEPKEEHVNRDVKILIFS